MAAKKEVLVYKSCKFEEIRIWCINNDQVDWLKKIMISKPQYFTIKRLFFEKFMPEAMPVKKAKKQSIYDIVNAM